MTTNYGSVDFSPYQINSRREIIALLRSLQDQNQLVSLQINNGAEAVVTSVLYVDEVNNTVIVDSAPNEQLNQRIAASDNIAFEAFLDHIRILFFASRVERCLYDKLPALRFSLPQNLIRLQRREFYRVATPVVNPVRCIITTSDSAEEPSITVATALQNISAGGVALVDEKKMLDNTPGKVYKSCRIDLPGGTPVTTTLQVRSTQELTYPNGKSIHRLGCMFIDLPKPALTAIQRYITKLEREQNARATGLK